MGENYTFKEPLEKYRTAFRAVFIRVSKEVLICFAFGFIILHQVIGLKISRHFFYPIRSKTITNRDSIARVFPALCVGNVSVLSFDWFSELSMYFMIC